METRVWEMDARTCCLLNHLPAASGKLLPSYFPYVWWKERKFACTVMNQEVVGQSRSVLAENLLVSRKNQQLPLWEMSGLLFLYLEKPLLLRGGSTPHRIRVVASIQPKWSKTTCLQLKLCYQATSTPSIQAYFSSLRCEKYQKWNQRIQI